MSRTQAAVTGVEGHLPDQILSNKDLERMVDTTDEWIQTRTGIQTRHILPEGYGSSYMGGEAAKKLLDKKGIDPNEIDLLICATVTPDHPFPATANIISEHIGAKNAWSFDLMAACSGLIYALTTASQFIESGMYQKVLVVGSDKMSSIIDYTDRATCIIFGDGAGAMLLEPSEDETGLVDSVHYSDGVGLQYLYQPAGGSVKPASHESVEAREHFVKQDGRSVFKFAVTHMAEVSVEIMERNGLNADNVNWLVPHQANLRIIDATADWMNLDKEKVMTNIQRYGNTTAGTIPLLLWEWEEQLKKGDNLVLSSFGGGFTWGAIYLKWSYDP
jgi:3-oxoacyl-[acyl-carrier-protein] synthase-3